MRASILSDGEINSSDDKIDKNQLEFFRDLFFEIAEIF